MDNHAVQLLGYSDLMVSAQRPPLREGRLAAHPHAQFITAQKTVGDSSGGNEALGCDCISITILTGK
jgi:hypothetical protein